MLMYTIAFYFGLFLIVFSMVATLFSEESSDKSNLLFFGGAGMVDIVAKNMSLSFTTRPNVREALAGLTNEP